MRRQIVPSTVGKRRSDGCQRAVRPEDERADEAGARVLVGEARRARRPRPARARRPGSRRARTRRSSPRRRAFTFAAKRRGRGFSSTRAPSGTLADAAGHVRDTSSSSTCGASAGSDSLELARMAVRDDDRRDLHRAEHLAVDRRASARPVVAPREARARARARRPRAGRARRARAGSRRRGRPSLDEDGRVAGDLAQRRLVERDDRRPAGHRLQHRQAEALEARRLDEAGGAAVELDELGLLDVAAQSAPRCSQLARERLVLHAARRRRAAARTAAAAASAASWFFRCCTAPTTST